jgi:hypothetical protein
MEFGVQALGHLEIALRPIVQVKGGLALSVLVRFLGAFVVVTVG